MNSSTETSQSNDVQTEYLFFSNCKLTVKVLLIAFGVFTIIAAATANGFLYAHIGYFSFAIGGGGMVAAEALLIAGILYCILDKKESKITPIDIDDFLDVDQKGKGFVIRLNPDKISMSQIKIDNLKFLADEVIGYVGEFAPVSVKIDAEDAGEIITSQSADKNIAISIDSKEESMHCIKHHEGSVIIFSSVESSKGESANQGFVTHMQAALRNGIDKYTDLVKEVILAVDAANQKIILEHDPAIHTHLGVVTYQHKDGSFDVIATSLGDFKLFQFKQNRELIEITQGNWRNIYGQRETGGQLGTQLDLKNFGVYVATFHKGDTLLTMSYGLYHKFHPRYTKLSPKEVLSTIKQDCSSDLALPAKWPKKGEESTLKEAEVRELQKLQEAYLSYRIRTLIVSTKTCEGRVKKIVKYASEKGEAKNTEPMICSATLF